MPDPVPEASVTAWALTVPEAMEDEASGLVWTAGCTGVTITCVCPGATRTEFQHRRILAPSCVP